MHKKYLPSTYLINLHILLAIVDAIELLVDVEVETDMLETIHILHPHLETGVQVQQVGCTAAQP
jgi:hypothetical protein